jgi:Mg/Co/Ni transporter MgtE
VLALVAPPKRAKLRALLGYDPAEAGGLMSPDFLCLYRHATVTEAAERVGTSAIPSEQLTTVYVMNTHRALVGAVPVAELLRARGETALMDLVEHAPTQLRPDAELEEVARLMSDFNLTAAPVVDEQDRMIGVVTVDDVLEVMLPKGWRRRFGLLGDE